jgi:hypothetical protein
LPEPERPVIQSVKPLWSDMVNVSP